MDGQRRIGEQMTKSNGRTQPKQPTGLAAFCQTRSAGVVARASAVLFLGLTIMHAVIIGDYLEYPNSPWLKIPGKLSSLVGMAADDITIKGLVHQDPEMVLAVLGVKPGGSLVGFNAGNAKKFLEDLDWVSSAKVQRLFPNQLEISVVEREPYAIWQRAGSYYVIDRTGSAMSNLKPTEMTSLPLVTGEGAQLEVEGLVNQLEASPALSSHLKAAARVGQRRWNLYLDNGITVLLPENDVQAALQQFDALEARQHLLSKGVKNVDLRFSGRMIVGISQIEQASAETVKPKASQTN